MKNHISSSEIEPEETNLNDFGLTRKQKEAIPHLVGARSFEEGCRKARIAKATLYGWLKNENFKAELERQRDEVINESLERLKSSVTQAIEGFIELMEAKEKPIRIRACEKILDFFFKTKEVEEIEDRLEKIEKIVLERKTYR